MENAMTKHTASTKGIFRHVKTTLDFSLVNKKRVGMKLLQYKDSDYAEDLDDRKSISWMSLFPRKQFDMLGLLETKDCGLIIV